jgi:hypothetical protein
MSDKEGHYKNLKDPELNGLLLRIGTSAKGFESSS